MVTDSSIACNSQSDLYGMESATFDDLCLNLALPCSCSGRWNWHSKRRVSLESLFFYFLITRFWFGHVLRFTGWVPVVQVWQSHSNLVKFSGLWCSLP